jgi:hypothetical protein
MRKSSPSLQGGRNCVHSDAEQIMVKTVFNNWGGGIAKNSNLNIFYIIRILRQISVSNIQLIRIAKMLFVTEESHILGICFEVNEKCKWNTRVRVNFGVAVLTH